MTTSTKQILILAVGASLLTYFWIWIWDNFIQRFAFNFILLFAGGILVNLNEFLTRENKPTLTIRVEKDSDILKK